MSWEPQLPIDPVKKAVKIEGVAGGVPVPVSGSLSATTTAHATAAAPSLVEGTDNQLSTDLSGNLRTLATATTAATATAADPAYGEGSTSAISQDRTGHLRVILPPGAATAAKQDTGNTSLASIDGKDFATQTTLALIKAKTDNLDAALSTRSTGARQDTGNASLASIDGKLTNPLPVSGSVTAAKATAAAPTYVEASNNPLSVDLAGNLRTISVGGTTYFPLTESSTYDGVSATLTLGHTPTDEPRVFIGGLRWYLGVHYSRVGAVITWISIPISGESIQVDYTWSMASSTLNTTLVVDVSGNIQPTGDTSARSIHVTVDSATSLALPSGAATAAGISTLADWQQMLQRLACAQLAQQRAALQLQATVSGQAMFLPEIPAFLGVA